VGSTAICLLLSHRPVPAKRRRLTVERPMDRSNAHGIASQMAARRTASGERGQKLLAAKGGPPKNGTEHR